MSLFTRLGGIRTAISDRWQSFCRELPFRMRIGKFGIWLAKVGRTLQERYANWNGEFRLQREFPPGGNLCIIHVSDRVTDEVYLTFSSPTTQPRKRTALVDKLFQIRGIAEVSLTSYEVRVTRAKVYSWRELLPVVEETVLRHLTA